jgi:UDP-N-acetylmuramoyl-tripeptide--D-alanyl-D-alanine ligase
MSVTIPWTVSEILDATHGILTTGNREEIFSGISIDSRNVTVNNLFVAIRGEKHDGHSFIQDVAQKGVKGFVISEPEAAKLIHKNDPFQKLVFIMVQDTIKALGDLASFNRTRSKIFVVAITGSNGKTTTQKMVTAVVRRRFSTLASQGNFNNQIGLPLTLLNLSSEHRWAVLEMGANHPGEIATLAGICRPDIGVVTNVGPAHLEGFGSLDGVASAKGELFDHMASNGVAVLNAEDKRVVSMAERALGKVLFYGTSKKAHIRASSIVEQNRGTSFILELPEEQVTIHIKIPGAFMVFNALAAASVGYQIGLNAAEIKAALENDFEPAQARMNILEIKNGIHLIDDTYNANPDSMVGALKTLNSLKGKNRSVFVAGDMFELGEHAAVLHEKIGQIVADTKVSRLYAVGSHAGKVAEGAISRGMLKENIFLGTKEEILTDLNKWLRTGDWVLVKGSRGMGMEQVVKGLNQNTDQS